jgi:hypothetical protein
VTDEQGIRWSSQIPNMDSSGGVGSGLAATRRRTRCCRSQAAVPSGLEFKEPWKGLPLPLFPCPCRGSLSRLGPHQSHGPGKREGTIIADWPIDFGGPAAKGRSDRRRRRRERLPRRSRQVVGVQNPQGRLSGRTFQNPQGRLSGPRNIAFEPKPSNNSNTRYILTGSTTENPFTC